MTEETIQKYIATEFNGNDSPAVRDQIRRTKVEDSGPPPSADRAPGESVADFYRRQASAQTAAQWNQRQLDEMNSQPVDGRLVSAQERIKLYETKARQPGTPAERQTAQRLLDEAKAELVQTEQLLATEQAAKLSAEFVASDPEITNARENIEAILRTVSRRGEDTSEFVGVLNRLKSATPETKNQIIQNAWERSNAFEIRESFRLSGTTLEKLRVAADAIKDLTAAEIEQLTVEHRARMAQFNAGASKEL